MDYKPFLVFIESYYVLKMSLKTFVFSPYCILDYVPECLLVGKFDH